MSQHIDPTENEALENELAAKGVDALADFDESKPLVVEAKRRPSKLISIRIPAEMMIALKEIATRRGQVGYQSLIKEFIRKGLLNEYMGDSARISKVRT